MERRLSQAAARSGRAAAGENGLGIFLKDRRAKLDPALFGFGAARRRTPGLRREEVAQRADVSATWYTWLEQGRGGPPSADVLDRLAAALLLTPLEREHLFLLAQHRPPALRCPVQESVSPQLQRVLDTMEFSPAFVKTSAWDIVAWNRAAVAVLGDYAALAPEQRNILRLLFCNPYARNRMSQPHWESHARLAVANFRLETARAGVSESAKALVEELSLSSPEFLSIWRDNDVGSYGEGIKHLEHPINGPLTLEYSTFAVSDHPDLSLVIFAPATPADRERIRALILGAK
jgi:transcriptional regulator with XRE-family HTH domain